LPPIYLFPELLRNYLYGLPVAAVLVFLSYFNRIEIPKWLKKLIFLLYSSKSVLGILIAAIFRMFDQWFAFSIAIWAIACYKLGHKSPLDD